MCQGVGYSWYRKILVYKKIKNVSAVAAPTCRYCSKLLYARRAGMFFRCVFKMHTQIICIAIRMTELRRVQKGQEEQRHHRQSKAISPSENMKSNQMQ